MAGVPPPAPAPWFAPLPLPAPPRIARASLLTLEAYAALRRATRAAGIAHRRLRSVALGARLLLQFEDEQTVRRQIQEVLHAEKVFEAEAIQHEIDAYAMLLPDGSNWKATLLIEIPDAAERRRLLPLLAGVEHRVFVEVEGHSRIHAAADEDLGPGGSQRPSATHFLRFELGADARAAVLGGAAVAIGCDHPACIERVAVPAPTLASLLADLR